MARRFVGFASATHRGRRSQNEDSVATVDFGGNRIALVVADGMGGHHAGDVASRVAVATFRSKLAQELPADDADALRMAFEAAAEAVAAETMRSNQDDMGTTFVGAIASAQGVHVLNVGDSPGLLVLPDRVVELTEAHTAANEAIRAGHITAEEAENSPYRHAVSRSLGAEVPEPSTRYLPLEDLPQSGGAVLLLASDGVANHVSEVDIRTALTTTPTLDLAAQWLLRRAVENGSTDNVTVALLELRPWERHPAVAPPPSSKKRALVAGTLVTSLVLVAGALTAAVLWKIRGGEVPENEAPSDVVRSSEAITGLESASSKERTVSETAAPDAKGRSEEEPREADEARSGREFGSARSPSAAVTPSEQSPDSQRIVDPDRAAAAASRHRSPGEDPVEPRSQQLEGGTGQPVPTSVPSPEATGGKAQQGGSRRQVTDLRLGSASSSSDRSHGSTPEGREEPIEQRAKSAPGIETEGPNTREGAASAPESGSKRLQAYALSIECSDKKGITPPRSSVGGATLLALVEKVKLKPDTALPIEFADNGKARQSQLPAGMARQGEKQRALAEALSDNFIVAHNEDGDAVTVTCKVRIVLAK